MLCCLLAALTLAAARLRAFALAALAGAGLAGLLAVHVTAPRAEAAYENFVLRAVCAGAKNAQQV